MNLLHISSSILNLYLASSIFQIGSIAKKAVNILFNCNQNPSKGRKENEINKCNSKDKTLKPMVCIICEETKEENTTQCIGYNTWIHIQSVRENLRNTSIFASITFKKQVAHFEKPIYLSRPMTKKKRVD